MLTAGRSQTGATLIELLVGLALSMIVTSSMVVLMSNSLGSATRIIQMTQLTDDMRNAMSMVSRDIRRANYSANSYMCYANSDCGLDGSTNQFDWLTALELNCLIYQVDRKQDGRDNTKPATVDDAGGFRRQTVVIDGEPRGYIEMWVGDNSPACGDLSDFKCESEVGCVDGPDDWIALTDPTLVDFRRFDFTLNDIPASVIQEDGATVTQHASEINMVIAADLVIDPTVTRQIIDSIKVRNDFLEVTGP